MPGELTIKVAGTEYPFPSFDTLTYKEARFIKSETGLVMGQFFKALEQGDPDALMAVALVALKRVGDVPDGLDDMLLDQIEIVVPEDEPIPGGPAGPLDASEPTPDDATIDRPQSSDETPSPS